MNIISKISMYKNNYDNNIKKIKIYIFFYVQ